MPARDFGFEPKGLPGYRVIRDRDGYWWYTRPAHVPHTFEWDEATQAHTKPVYNDWAEARRGTAAQAVAAAHQHDAWAKKKMETAS